VDKLRNLKFLKHPSSVEIGRPVTLLKLTSKHSKNSTQTMLQDERHRSISTDAKSTATTWQGTIGGDTFPLATSY